MNIFNLDLRPQCHATLWSMHPADLCRMSPAFADIQQSAALLVRNPTCIAVPADGPGVLPSKLTGPCPLLLVYPPRGLSEHICELALEVPQFLTRHAADFRSQSAYLSWRVQNVRLCVEAPFFVDLVEGMSSMPKHFVVAFVGRDEVAAQAVAVDSDFCSELSECFDELNRELVPGDPDDVAWLDEYRHRGPWFLYDDGAARDGSDLVWVYLERHLTPRRPGA